MCQFLLQYNPAGYRMNVEYSVGLAEHVLAQYSQLQ